MIKNFCVVGLGNHAINRIIPSLKESKNNLVAVVSSKQKLRIKKIVRYKTLNEAICNLNKNTIFILCTPPLIHEKQLIYLLGNGYSIIVEKPAIITKKICAKFSQIKLNKHQFIFENYMYKQTKIYNIFLKIFKLNKNILKEINITFTIPKFPKNTFRSKMKRSDSIIFDIGCYPVSLVNDLFNYNKFKIIILKSNTKNLSISLRLDSTKIPIILKFGISKNYVNEVCLKTSNNDIFKFDYFFYGRPKLKKIIKNQSIILSKINDQNAFVKIFNKNNIFFKKNSLTLAKLTKNISILNKIQKLT